MKGEGPVKVKPGPVKVIDGPTVAIMLKSGVNCSEAYICTEKERERDKG